MRNTDADAVILERAQKQHGVVARWQLVPAGVSSALIDERIKRGRLRRVEWCVYRVPGLDGPRRDVTTSVLACGPDAVASHDTAGDVHELLTGRPPRTVVSVSRGGPRSRATIVLHRVRLRSDERTVCDGVPLTTLARTLLDLAGVLSDRAFEQAVARGLRVNDVPADELMKLIARYPRRPGAARLRAMLVADDSPAMTRSEAEEQFLALVRRAQLPEPQVNVRVHGFEVDFFWRGHNLVVEIDGLAYHTSRAAQRRDRHRDSSLAAAGLRVLRFTWEDLTKRPEVTLAKVALGLGSAGV